MTGDTRAYLAFTAGKFVSRQEVNAVYDREGEQQLKLEEPAARLLKNHPAITGCGVRRDPEAANYCITAKSGDQHVCLSLYGKLFEGYDHGTASHFTGFVDNGMITLYDFGESKFFTFDYEIEKASQI